MTQILLYTDGSCLNNPGPGGWACLFKLDSTMKVLYGSVNGETTNNRMELIACIEGLNHLKRPCDVLVITDSQYVKQGITEWMPAWVRKNWKTRGGKPVKNRDLWEELVDAEFHHNVQWQWVKGHDGNPYNEAADHYAVTANYEHLSRSIIEVSEENLRGSN